VRIEHEFARRALVEITIPCGASSSVMTVALTISAIGRRSCRTACMSWRLYRRTGACPVWKDWLLIQPQCHVALLCARILGHIKPRDADHIGGTGDFHGLVEDDRRLSGIPQVGRAHPTYGADAAGM